MLRVNEAFYSIQGEGANVGMPAIFIRLAGCNLSCAFCDTDYEKGQDFSVDDIIQVASTPSYHSSLPVIITGGEPLMQKETAVLIQKLLEQKRRVIIETNGTFRLLVEYPRGVPTHYLHICVSPKVPFKDILIAMPDSIKILYPFMKGITLTDYLQSKMDAREVFIQPIDNDKKAVQKIVEILKFHPKIRLSVQVHKLFKLM